MKTTFLLVINTFCTFSLTAQEINIHYDYYGKPMVINSIDSYDIELKPQVFTISVSNSEEINFAVVDVFRTMQETHEDSAHNHYFTTFLLPRESAKMSEGVLTWENSLDIKSLFLFNKSRFLRTKGFSFQVCLLSSPQGIVDSPSECILRKQFRIRYGD